MKSALSIALIICLVGSTFPVTAQEQMPTAGPLARAATRAAARFTAVAQPRPGDSVWSLVRELNPGTEITVTVKGLPPGQRHFIVGDESSLTVLNLTDQAIPAAVRDVLVDTVSDHPIYFVLAEQGKTFLLDDNVRLTRESIFAGDERVAAFEQIVVHIARDSVAEVSVSERHVGRATGWGAVIGAGAGLVVGLLTGRRRCERQNCDNFPPIAFGLIYSMVGGGIGSGLGAVLGATRGKTRNVMYQAP